MASEEEKKKYWCDQIKTMIGPCMITFSIPMMIPGFTITFVAFAEDDSFHKYGILHVVGILILGIAIILLILGCILRFYWKPFISPDIEMHLSPKRTQKLEESNSRIMSPGRNTQRARDNVSLSSRSTLRARMDDRPISIKKTEKSESETEGTGSESELKTLTGNSDRNFDMMASPRSRNLMPVNPELFDETYNSQPEYKEMESYEVLRDYRRKKKAKKRTKQTANEAVQLNIENGVEQENQSSKQHDLNPDNKRQRRKKKKKKVLKSLKNEQKETSSDGNYDVLHSVNESNNPYCDMKSDNNTLHEHSLHAHDHQAKKDGSDSDHSSISIGSADSVLAQYTSRSAKD